MDSQYSRELREERKKLADQMAAIANVAREEKRKLSSEEKAQFDKINVDIDDLTERALTAERCEEVTRAMSDPARTEDGKLRIDDGRITDREPADKDKIVTRQDVDYAFRAWGMGREAPDEFRKAAEKVGLHDASKMQIQLADSRRYAQMRAEFRRDGISYRATTAQSKGTNAAGGFTVPTELSNRLEVAMLNYGGMRSVATILRTNSGSDLNLPTADDTTALASVLAENTAATVSNLTFAQTTLRAAKYSSGVVLASIELLQDTAIDLVGYVGDALGTRLARGTHADYSTGSTATTSPRGIIRDTFEGYAATTGTGGDIGVRPLAELFHSVDIEYRNKPGAGWMMHDGIMKELRYEVDSNGLPLWQPSIVAGQPDMLMGKMIVTNNRLVSSTTGAGAKTVLFGDLSSYVIREVMGVDIIRFDERYMEKLQVGWLGVLRTDGKLVLASTRNASKPVAHLKGTT